MSKLVKELITRELQSRYADESNAVWIELVGVDGLTTNAFRRDLRSRQMRMEVIKTSLFRKACATGPLARLAGALTGPAAIITGGETAIDVAKLLDDWQKKFPKDSYRLRGAVLDGEYLDEGSVKNLSKMPTKADLQAKIVRIILTPGANVVGAALGPGRKLASILKSVVEKLEKGESLAKTS